MADELEKKYGARSATLASVPNEFDVIPTGSLSLDYALGTGGWPSKNPIEIFGPPDIGKSTLGLYAIAGAQQQGKQCVVIALEPNFDGEWASKHGVDTDNLIIARPDNGEQAFQMLYDCVTNDVGFVLFDSIGAMLYESEVETGKQKQGGQALLVTGGIKRANMVAWKSNTTLMFINQVRDAMGPYAGMVDSPGGNALKHLCPVRVQLKPGRERYNQKIHGDDVMVGRQLVAVIKRTKVDQGTNKTAVFDYYSVEHPNVPFGIDWTTDILNVAKRVGIIKPKGAYLEHEAFGTAYAKDVIEQMKKDSELVNTLRQGVLNVMKGRDNGNQATIE